MFDRDLYKTKLCTLYQRGHCPRQSCSFAHGDAELRRFSSSGSDYCGKQGDTVTSHYYVLPTPESHGRRDYRGGDLREKLDRRHSPYRRSSPGRDSRGHQGYTDQRSGPYDRGHSPSRSPPRGSERRDRRRQHVDGHLSDVSEDFKNSEGGSEDGHTKEIKSPYTSSRDMLEDQLRHVQADIDALNDQKDELEDTLEKETEEANKLAAKNMELEFTLSKEQEDHKRLGSKIKKFIKVHLRFVRAQEEVKKTQIRLQKLVEEFPLTDASRPVNHGEDSDVNVVSDGEPNHANETQLECGGNYATAGTEKEDKEDSDLEAIDADKNGTTKRRASFSRDKSRAAKFARLHGSIRDKESNTKEADLVASTIGRSQVLNDKEARPIANKSEDRPSRGRSARDGSLSPISVPAEKVKGWDSGFSLPSTSMAAHAEDDQVEAVDIDDKDELTDASRPKEENVSLFRGLPITTESLNAGKGFLGPHLPPLTSVSLDHYNEYKGDDEEVDVEGVDAEDRGINLNIQAEVC